MGAKLKIRLLGRFEWDHEDDLHPDQELPLPTATKSRSLLAHPASRRPEQRARERLMAIFWCRALRARVGGRRVVGSGACRVAGDRIFCSGRKYRAFCSSWAFPSPNSRTTTTPPMNLKQLHNTLAFTLPQVHTLRNIHTSQPGSSTHRLFVMLAGTMPGLTPGGIRPEQQAGAGAFQCGGGDDYP